MKAKQAQRLLHNIFIVFFVNNSLNLVSQQTNHATNSTQQINIVHSAYSNADWFILTNRLITGHTLQKSGSSEVFHIVSVALGKFEWVFRQMRNDQ